MISGPVFNSSSQYYEEKRSEKIHLYSDFFLSPLGEHCLSSRSDFTICSWSCFSLCCARVTAEIPAGILAGHSWSHVLNAHGCTISVANNWKVSHQMAPTVFCKQGVQLFWMMGGRRNGAFLTSCCCASSCMELHLPLLLTRCTKTVHGKMRLR